MKEEFAPLNPPHVLFYNCGPTVYDYFHLGNARNFVVADIIRRHLEYRGYKVRFVQNITDIDDKIIKRSNEEGIPASEVAEKYTKVFFEQCRALGIRRADLYPKATENIPQMHDLIKKLIDKGHAYVLDGDVYFSVRSFPTYGQLSGRNIDELLEGARVEVDERKRDPLDFALWKSAKPGEPAWDSPWGQGRPGWHIECSAMSLAHLGESIDIHSGGTDLIFPHHENERAQSEAATGKTFVKYWVHNGFLNINTQKMSKSLGNFFTIDQVLAHYDPLTVKFFLLSAHYRHPLDYNEENMENARNSSRRILDALDTVDKLLSAYVRTSADLRAFPPSEDLRRTFGESVEFTSAFDKASANLRETEAQEDIKEKWVQFRRLYEDAMDDDFNTARALSTLHDIVTEIHEVRKSIGNSSEDSAYVRASADLRDEQKRPLRLRRMDEKRGIFAGLKLYRNILLEFLHLLGLDPALAERGAGAEGEVMERLMQILIDVRQMARENKEFKIADAIRDRLSTMGISLEDHPQGTIWKRK
jgi:cysteinyl-tRNA synthetase